MSSAHVLPLHFAESLNDLHKKARAGRLNVEKASANLILAMATTFRAQAIKHLSEGDEELAYFFLYRFVESLEDARKKEDYSRSMLLHKHLLASRPDSTLELEKLRSHLLTRYSNSPQHCESYEWSTSSTRRKVDYELFSRFIADYQDFEFKSTKSVEMEMEKQVVEICKLKMRKLPLNFSQLLAPSTFYSFTSSASSSNGELPQKSIPSSSPVAKITVVDVDPQPGNAFWESSQFCDDLKRKTFGVDDGEGGVSLDISFQAVCLDEERKVVGLSIRVDGPFVEKLFADAEFGLELEKLVEMRLTMRLIGKRQDLFLRDVNMKVFRNEKTSWFGIYVGLIALDEWVHESQQPKVKVVLQLINKCPANR